LENNDHQIGRDTSCSIQLHDSEISRHHAELKQREQSLFITDLGSSNGTFVNGQQSTEHRLANGDHIQVGGTLMLFTDSSGVEDALAESVAIVPSLSHVDQSHIVRAMPQAAGSQIMGDFSEEGSSPWLSRARSNLQVMYRTALAVSHTLDIDELLRRIMQFIFEWVESDRGCIMMFDPESHELMPKVRRDRKGVESEDQIRISKTILDYVTDKNEGVLTSDARQDERWDSAPSILQMGVREAICVPMRGRYDVVGVIYIDTTTSPERVLRGAGNKFNEEHLKLMIAIAHQAALAVEDTRYYSAMVQAERLAAVGQTIAMLSHHVKNILQGVRGASYLIDEGLKEHDEELIRKGWGMVERNQDKIWDLVMDMLTFSKEREPELVESDLNQVVADVVELMQSRADDLGVEISWTPSSDMVTATFDPDGIHRAVLNIITNAIDACDEKTSGLVQISTSYDPTAGMLQITVTDNGQGISPEDMDKLFSIFFSRKGGRGTGLGLSVSQKILKEHGGHIRVRSRVGEGSCFTLELPAHCQGSTDQDDQTKQEITK